MAKAEPRIVIPVWLTPEAIGVIIACLDEREDWREARDLSERLDQIRNAATRA